VLLKIKTGGDNDTSERSEKAHQTREKRREEQETRQLWESFEYAYIWLFVNAKVFRDLENHTDSSNICLSITMVWHFQHIGPPLNIYMMTMIFRSMFVLVGYYRNRYRELSMPYRPSKGTEGAATSFSHIFVLFLKYFGTAKSMWSTKTKRWLRHDCWLPEIAGFLVI